MNVAVEPAVKPAKQRRSQETFERILDAAEALLNERSFDDLRIEDIVKRARTSVGVFYSRLRDKEALLDALYERNQRDALARFATWDPEHWAGVGVEAIVRMRVKEAVQLHRENRGLYRALVLRGYVKPDWRYRDPEERDKLAIGRFSGLIASHADEIAHEDAKTAGSMAGMMIIAALREAVLFDDSTASAVQLTDAQLEREIVRMVLAYLGVRETPRGAA